VCYFARVFPDPVFRNDRSSDVPSLSQQPTNNLASSLGIIGLYADLRTCASQPCLLRCAGGVRGDLFTYYCTITARCIGGASDPTQPLHHRPELSRSENFGRTARPIEARPPIDLRSCRRGSSLVVAVLVLTGTLLAGTGVRVSVDRSRSNVFSRLGPDPRSARRTTSSTPAASCPAARRFDRGLSLLRSKVLLTPRSPDLSFLADRRRNTLAGSYHRWARRRCAADRTFL